MRGFCRQGDISLCRDCKTASVQPQDECRNPFPIREICALGVHTAPLNCTGEGQHVHSPVDNAGPVVCPNDHVAVYRNAASESRTDRLDVGEREPVLGRDFGSTDLLYQSRARGCAVAKTSRRLSTVTSV